MKKKIYILLTLMLMCMGTATAADQLTVEDVTITQGQQATVAVGFKFDQSGLYAGYQFVLNLPDGISITAYIYFHLIPRACNGRSAVYIQP